MGNPNAIIHLMQLIGREGDTIEYLMKDNENFGSLKENLFKKKGKQITIKHKNRFVHDNSTLADFGSLEYEIIDESRITAEEETDFISIHMNPDFEMNIKVSKE
jgi:hypothetical protein